MFENGIINIDKPEGWTSQDVVAKLRHRLHIRRVGHTGTLDPMATGVLPICFGKATRIIEYYDADLKVYRAELQLGVRTDTLDRTGEVIETHAVCVTEEEIRAAFASIDGWITQIPPKYSALKVNGKPLYKYAREGKDVEIKPRLTYIDQLNIESISADRTRVVFTVSCSKGTYIRTICDDVGTALGCGAIMTSLVRIASGCFAIEDALPLAEVIDMTDEELASKVIAMEDTLERLGKAQLKSNASIPFYRNGRSIDVGYMNILAAPSVPAALQEKSGLNDKYRIYDAEGVFLGVSRLENEVFCPDKVIG